MARRAVRFEPTDEQRRNVLTMTGLGIIQDEIARWLDIDDKTLRKHFRRELDTGAIEANMRVAQSLFTMATKDKVPACAIWWSKARMGWREARATDPAANGDGIAVLRVEFVDPRDTQRTARHSGAGHSGAGHNGSGNGDGRTIDSFAISFEAPTHDEGEP